LACLIVAATLLRAAPRRWSRWVLDRPSPADAAPFDLSTLARLADLQRGGAAVLRRWPVSFACLSRSLAARWMLNRRGVPNTLYVGIRSGGARASETLHAWLTVGDTVLLGGPVEGYVPMISFGAAPSGRTPRQAVN
jgi:hypothetical protein